MECEDKNCEYKHIEHYHCSECGTIFTKKAVKEFLEEKGEGIQHIGFFVDDLDQETAKMAEKGFTITQSGETPTVKWAYFDTDKVGGASIELMQKTSK